MQDYWISYEWFFGEFFGVLRKFIFDSLFAVCDIDFSSLFRFKAFLNRTDLSNFLLYFVD